MTYRRWRAPVLPWPPRSRRSVAAEATRSFTPPRARASLKYSTEARSSAAYLNPHVARSSGYIGIRRFVGDPRAERVRNAPARPREAVVILPVAGCVGAQGGKGLPVMTYQD